MADQKYRDESYLGDPADDSEEPEVRDLGFIVDDRDDRRIETVGEMWDRLDDLDTDAAVGEEEKEPLPLDARSGEPPADAFASLYNLGHVEGEEQEEDFVETSMLATDPDGGAGADDFTDESDLDADGRLETAGITGHVAGIARGFGTDLLMDIGSEGFEVRDNPLMQPVDPEQPISGEQLSDEALGRREVDEMGSEAELDRLADEGARVEAGRKMGGGKGDRGSHRLVGRGGARDEAPGSGGAARDRKAH